MLLTAILFVPALGALMIALLPSGGARQARTLALAVSVLELLLVGALVVEFKMGVAGFQFGVNRVWVAAIGVHYHLGVDGISVFLVALTAVLSPLALIAPVRRGSPRSYAALILVLESMTIGVFVSLDLLLFYVFWEGLLVPSYFLIGAFGGERRVYAAVKFFIYTLLGGLVMLLGIIGLAEIQRRSGQPVNFDYAAMLRVHLTAVEQKWLFGAFFVAFAIKVPLFPFHTWLPDAYAEAPTGMTVLLSGVLSKMGAYGFLRFALPLFPAAAHAFAPILIALAVINVLYAAVVAIMQRDLKRLLAYSSMSHLGFVILGIFAFTLQGIQGAVFFMVAHGVISAGLFFVTGMLEQRRGTTRIDAFGGLQHIVPRMAGVMLTFVFASVALPGLAGFVGELLTLAGAFVTHELAASLATLGIVLSVVYMLWSYQRVWYGAPGVTENRSLRDLGRAEWALVAPLLILVVVLGLYPNPLLGRIAPSARREVARVHLSTALRGPLAVGRSTHLGGTHVGRTHLGRTDRGRHSAAKPVAFVSGGGS